MLSPGIDSKLFTFIAQRNGLLLKTRMCLSLVQFYLHERKPVELMEAQG